MSHTTAHELATILGRVGKCIETAWAESGFEESAFAEISTRALRDEEANLRQFDVETLVRWVASGDYPALELPDDNDNGYGSPTITFVRTPRLRVEMIFWFDDVAGVHGHPGPGIFYSLHGHRLHATYKFNYPADREVSPREPLVLGDLHCTNIELLEPGDLRPIPPGYRDMHALVFLGRPCVTISIRAAGEDFALLLEDHVLVDVKAKRTRAARLSQALQLFLQLHPEELASAASQMLRQPGTDILSAQTLLLWLRKNESDDVYAPIYAVARERFGDWIDKVIAAAERREQRRSIEALIKTLGDQEDHRGPRAAQLLASLLWLNADPKLTLALLRNLFSAEPDPLAVIDRFIVAIRGPRSPREEFSATLGLTPEDNVSAMLRQFRKRLAVAAAE